MENSRLSIKLLADNKKVIPLYFKTGETWHTNIKMPDLVIYNNGKDEIKVKEVSLSGFSEGRNVVVYKKGEEDIKQVIAITNMLLNKYMRKSKSKWSVYNLHTLFGDVPLTQDTYEETNQLKSNSMTCLQLQKIFHFLYSGDKKVDQVSCLVTLKSRGNEINIDIPILLTPYNCKGDYIFPIKGSATVIGTPWNLVEGHREATSQEFAFDIAGFRRSKNEGFTLSSPPNSDTVEDYYIFEREILAIGSGTISATGNQWPNEWVENPLEYSVDRIVEYSQTLLNDGVDFNHVVLGNYVIINHHNGEFSLYAHMSEGSLAVEVGDAIKQGQVIGKVGNTSNSTDPHLHFQLMDSKDFQTANSLPIVFKNLPIGHAPLCNFDETNSLLYSDYLFVQIPD